MTVRNPLALRPAKPAAPKPAVEKPAAAKTAAAKPAATGAKPAAAKPAVAAKDTASILAAARGGAKPGPITKAQAAANPAAAKLAPKAAAKEPKEKPVAPPMPAKPAYAKPAAKGGEEQSRRGFFGLILGTAFAVGMTSLALTNTLWGLAVARFMFPNVLTEPPSRFKVGFKDNFAPGQVETKFVSMFGVWIVNGEYNGKQQIYALKTVCTHLGCTPNWLEAEQKFKCPCHGSGFYKDGINFEGPRPASSRTIFHPHRRRWSVGSG